MRAVVQRVSESRVEVDGKVVGCIKEGLLIFLGVGATDTRQDAEYMAQKIANLRIFCDDEGKMNLSLLDVGKEALVISQFTLYGDCRRGRRPSFTEASDPEKANDLYRYFIERLKLFSIRVQEGIFQAMMNVYLCNDGPVTLLLDSKKEF